MPSMNVVATELVEPVECGRVKQMVVRGDCYRVGDVIFIHADLFSESRRKLRSTRCDWAQAIEVCGSNRTVILNNRLLLDDEKEDLAKHCGFKNFTAFIDCYRSNGGLPLKGQLVRWL